MSDDKLDRIMEKLDRQGEDLVQIKTILLPPNEEPPLSVMDRRLDKLELWRSFLTGAWAVLASLLGLHEGLGRR